MTIAEFHKKFEEEISKHPNNFPQFTQKEWEKIWNEIMEKDWFKEGLQELRKKKRKQKNFALIQFLCLMELILVFGLFMSQPVQFVTSYILEIMERIPINKLMFDLLNGGVWDYDIYRYSDIVAFKEVIPETAIEIEDKINTIYAYLSKEILVLDDLVNYRDLEKGYEERTLIFKYKGEIYGLDYDYSVWEDWNTFKGYIDELPKYKEVQVTTYKQI